MIDDLIREQIAEALVLTPYQRGQLSRIEYRPERAQAERETLAAAVLPIVKAAQAEAWDEGAETAWSVSTPEVNGQRYHWRTSGEPRNPYSQGRSCGHPNHGSPDHDCLPFLDGDTR